VLLKVVALFLVFMLVMASVQKLLRGGKGRDRKAIDRLRCPKCSRIRITAGNTACERQDCEYKK